MRTHNPSTSETLMTCSVRPKARGRPPPYLTVQARRAFCIAFRHCGLVFSVKQARTKGSSTLATPCSSISQKTCRSDRLMSVRRLKRRRWAKSRRWATRGARAWSANCRAILFSGLNRRACCFAVLIIAGGPGVQEQGIGETSVAAPVDLTSFHGATQNCSDASRGAYQKVCCEKQLFAAPLKFTRRSWDGCFSFRVRDCQRYRVCGTTRLRRVIPCAVKNACV